LNLVQEIQQFSIYRMHLAGSMVAQEAVNTDQRLGNVLPILPVDQRKFLIGVSVLERE
jgi:hypothetical protein